MLQIIKRKLLISLQTEKLSQFIILLLVVSIYFPIRKVFPTAESFIIGQFSDFTTFSLYLSDILVIFYILINIKHLPSNIKKAPHISSLILLLLLTEIILNKTNYNNIVLFQTLRLITYLFFYIQIKTTDELISKVLNITIILSVIQSLLAIIQVFNQSSIGFHLLGEPHLSTNIYGVAKIITDNTTIIRAYGTSPHSNILAGLLSLGLFASLLKINLKQPKESILLIISYFLIITGLTLTFSRGIFISVIITHLIWLFYILKNKNQTNYFKTTFLSLIFVTLSICSILYISSNRNQTKDSSIQERVNQIDYSKALIKKYYLLGTGLGNSMLHMEQFSKNVIKPWDYQPIHNYYLLVISELGIVLGTIFVIYILSPLKMAYKKLSTTVKSTGTELILITIYISMLFDHYYFTIPTMSLLLIMLISFQNKQSNVTHETKEILPT
jgi:hypothetical protein